MTKGISILARIALVTATVIWGASFVIMKNTLDAMPSFYLLAIRFTMATVVLSLIFMPKLKKLNKEYLIGGGIMGAFIFMAYGLQTVGLVYTTPGKNAFLTACYCIIVPFLYWFTSGKRPDAYNLTAAAMCVIGVWLVSVNPASEAGINRGDVLTLACSFMYACHIIAVNKYGEDKDIILLTILQFATAAIGFWIFGLVFEDFPQTVGPEAITSLLFLGLMATAAALLLQNIGQKYTPPATAALLLSLEAVFGVLFSVVFAQEPISVPVILGFGLIFAALVISETKPGLARRALNEK